MKLLEFHPKGFRNLADLPIYLTFAKEEPAGKNCSIRFLAGLNGTGKSTLLRFLAAIFAALDEGYQHYRPDNPAYSAPFVLRYRLREDSIKIENTGGGRAQLIFWINGEVQAGLPSADQILPETLLIYTSGDTEAWRKLLHGHPPADQDDLESLPEILAFDDEDLDSYDDLDSEDSISEEDGPQPSQPDRNSPQAEASEELSVFNRITLVEPGHLPFAFLVACLGQIAEQEQQVSIGADFDSVLKQVGIDRLVSFSLRLRYNPDLLSEAQRRRLSRLSQTATATQKQADTWLWIYDIDDVREGQGPASRLMPALKENQGQAYQLFQDLIRLYDDSVRAAQLPSNEKALELLEINQIINKPLQGNQKELPRLLLFNDLSDGERAYLTRIALIQLLGKRESLFLLDEPETHFNDEWKRNLVDQIERTIEDTNSQVILTTHASIVLTDAFPEEVILLDNGVQQSVPLTFATEQNELLRSVFGADRSVGRRSMNRVKYLIEQGSIDELNTLLDQVGPGFFRYQIIEALEKHASQDQTS